MLAVRLTSCHAALKIGLCGLTESVRPGRAAMRQRARSVPASPRSASPVHDAALAPERLSKAEYARLVVESQKFAFSRAHKEATMQRKAWRSQWQEDQLQQRAQNVLSTKESKESMRTSVKQSQEEASQNVTEQRAFLQEMATRRAELRADHAALGKELHSRHYGAEAGAKRSQMMATKHEERRQLGEKGALLAAQMSAERAAAHAARSASAERVRQQNVTKSVYAAEMDIRQAQGRAQRMHSAQIQNLIGATRQQHREHAEELRQRVKALEGASREALERDLAEKRFRAQLVREANDSVNAAVDEARMNTARRRKAIRNWIVAEKSTDAPAPPVAGGFAGSRRASLAAAFAARSAPLVVAGTKARPPAANELHQSTKAAGHIFEPGPTGLTFAEAAAGVVVGDVAAGSAASALQVPLGGVVLAVNSQPVCGLTRIGVQRAIAKANWPMTLLVTPCPEHVFKDKGPLGLALQDTQNGVIVKGVLPDSPASRRELPIGGLIVTVNSASATGLSKADIAQQLKRRPLSLQVVPRDVAYLFRPRGPYKKTTSASVAEASEERDEPLVPSPPPRGSRARTPPRPSM